MLLHYVDDIVAATTDRELREAFFDHIRKKWAITAEGLMNRFLGISYTWDREKGSCKASAAAYIRRDDDAIPIFDRQHRLRCSNRKV